MGCGGSKVDVSYEDDGGGKINNVTTKESLLQYENKWRVKLSKDQSRKAYIADGTLPPNAGDDLVALRVFLEDHAAIIRLAEYAKRKGLLDYLLCWIEILEFKKIERGNDYKLSKANYIYHKYFKEDAVVCLLPLQDAVPFDDQNAVKDKISTAEKQSTYELPSDLFDSFGHECLRQIYAQLYQPYKSSMMYAMSLRALKQQVNHVSVDDFEYMDLLGQGAFGLVVHCKKKSTGKHYAMKIQTKIGLLECYADAPQRVTYEKEALAKCHHPFIISMDYAFQTPELAIMVTALGTGDSLQFAMKIPEDNVKFYAAEIILALNHIHQLGMIYRDLKPSNILLNSDGHIQLVDLGGVVDVGGQTLGKLDCRSAGAAAEEDALFGYSERISAAKDNEMSLFGSAMMMIGSMNLYSPSMKAPGRMGGSSPSAKSATRRGGSMRAGAYKPAVVEPPPLERAKSIMGTAGFMAPEMVAVLAFSAGNSRKSNCGYTQAVDYWSLGVTIFVLLTGSLPFHHDKVAGFLQHLEEQHQNDSGDSATSDHKPAPPDYARWYDKVSKSVSSNRMSNECMSVLTGLLCIDENKRLGGGKDGVKHLKLHPWFSDISWRMLTQKLVVPPQLPSAVQKSVLSATSEDQEENPYSSFVEMLKDLGNSNLRLYGVAAPTPIYQNYFSTWDFIAPSALRDEVGAEEEARIRTKMVEQIAAARPRKESLTNSFAMMRSSVSNSGLFRDLTFASSHHPDAESSHSGSGRAGAISSNNSNKANSNNNNSVLSPPVDKPPSMMANTANSRAFSVDRVNASITSPIIALLGSSFMSPNRVSINVNVPDPTVAVNTEPSAAAFGTTKDAATIVSVGNVLKSMESNNATERDRLGSTSVSVSNRNGTSERTVGQTALMITKQ